MCAHPSRGSYVSGCRCLGCRVANSEYEYGRTHGARSQVAAGRARNRVKHLHEEGMAYREIARSAGVSRTVVYNLVKAHWRTGKPVKRMSKASYDKVMAVKDPIRDRCPGKRTLVNNSDFVRCADALVARGMPVAEIARRIGASYSTVYARHGRTKVTAETALKMFRMFRCLISEASCKTAAG
jgi:transposase